MKKVMLALVLTLSLATPLRVHAAGGDIEAMKMEIDSLKKDMDEIKRVLISVLPAIVRNDRGEAQAQAIPTQRAEAPQQGAVSIKDSPSMGKGELVLVEFSDYECSFCARFHMDTFKQLKKEYIDTGRLRFVYRDFPLPFHQNAMKASLAAGCAGEQGKYWEMHEALFVNQQTIGDVDGLVKKTGLNATSFNKCMDGKKYEDAVTKDINDGRELGVNGTPTFILGKLDASGKVSGEVIQGAVPYSVFKGKIDALLK